MYITILSTLEGFVPWSLGGDWVWESVGGTIFCKEGNSSAL